MALTRVLVRLQDQGWSRVGQAGVETDARSGVRFLRIDLAATAPTLFIPLQDILVLEAAPLVLADLSSGAPVEGHA